MKKSMLLKAALGNIPCDLVIKNGKIIDVFNGDIVEQDLGIYNGYFVGIGDYTGKNEIDIKGKYISPAFIDAHIHIESTMLTPLEFARVAIKHGSQAVICDPHEIANVMGIDGIELFIKMSKNLHVEFYFMAPSCVPATNMETSGAAIKSEHLEYLYKKYPDKILGLAEVMNFPGVMFQDKDIWKKLAISRGKIIDGHCPMLSGKELNAYILAGPRSDHECTTKSEVEEKLKRGMYIFARNGSTQKNLPAIIPVVNQKNVRNFCLVTDDRHPKELIQKGHMDYNIKEAIKNGADPIWAIQMATINPAHYYNLKDIGIISPGYKANFVIINDLFELDVEDVYINGTSASKLKWKKINIPMKNSINAKIDVDLIKIKDVKGKKVHVIGIKRDEIITEHLILPIEDVMIKQDNCYIPNINNDILKLVVIERHKNSGNIGIGFVKGFGINKGAIASTIAHDSHNIICAGSNDDDILFAVELISKTGGGMVVVKDKEVLGHLPLPLAGLISDRPAEEVMQLEEQINFSAKQLGDTITNPFMYLSFLALPVIPHLKLTDMGLVDVDKFNFISLFE